MKTPPEPIRYLRTLFITLGLITGLQLTAISALHAETRTEYAIDIVVFEDSKARYPGSEQWAAAANTDEAAPTTEASTGKQTSLTGKLDAVLKPNIRDINPGSYDLLNSAVKRLTSSPRYHILVRKSWLQPGLDRSNAVDIDLSSTGNPAATDTTGSISGSVKIVLERYLHLYTDLVYHKPGSSEADTGISITPASTSVSPSFQTENFVIRDHRRMRSKELHYIDHPLVGILIKIVPVETNIKDSQ
jgi:hypothetical protein